MNNKEDFDLNALTLTFASAVEKSGVTEEHFVTRMRAAYFISNYYRTETNFSRLLKSYSEGKSKTAPFCVTTALVMGDELDAPSVKKFIHEYWN